MITVKSLQSSVIKADHVDPVFWSLINDNCAQLSHLNSRVFTRHWEIREFSIHFAELILWQTFSGLWLFFIQTWSLFQNILLYRYTFLLWLDFLMKTLLSFTV